MTRERGRGELLTNSETCDAIRSLLQWPINVSWRHISSEPEVRFNRANNPSDVICTLREPITYGAVVDAVAVYQVTRRLKS